MVWKIKGIILKKDSRKHLLVQTIPLCPYSMSGKLLSLLMADKLLLGTQSRKEKKIKTTLMSTGHEKTSSS